MTRTAPVVGVAAAVVVAWAGFFIHNLADLPEQSILNPESLFPTLIWAALLPLWLVTATRSAGAWALLVWATINAVGGALSVLPLEFLSYEPAQTLEHYGAHLLYLLTQLPLIILTSVWLRRHARPRAGAATNPSVR